MHVCACVQKYSLFNIYIIALALNGKVVTHLALHLNTFLNKKMALFSHFYVLAEDTGFEPADALTSTVFKTAALNHSANPP